MQLPTLKPGDKVEIIAPASRCSDQELASLKNLLESWQLECIIPENIFGKDLLCANTDEARSTLLKNALLNPESKAVICARGGYGSMRLIPELNKMTPPSFTKLFVGMSDITALHLYLRKIWKWPTLHGALSVDKFSEESITAVKSILFKNSDQIEFKNLIPLNKLAEKKNNIHAEITGGNLCLVQNSIGTSWQMEGKEKIILLEEIGERGYRVDRMLEQLTQANLFRDAAAIIMGDFLDGKEPNGSILTDAVLERFAEQCEVPVLRITGIGHGKVNFPIPLGLTASLSLGQENKLVCRC